MLVDLAREAGLNPKRASSGQRRIFHSACPSCGGKDRFVLWADEARYWCRQCKISGDAIQFCRAFLGTSFSEAKERVGDVSRRQPKESSYISFSSWQEKAKTFIRGAHQRLLIDPKALTFVQERGLLIETISRYQIGWHPLATFPRREEWGLEKCVENGKEKKLLLPAGIVIPCFQDDLLCKVKIRRSDWIEGCLFGKYYIASGSIDCMPVFGDADKSTVVIVESEIDGMLVVQEVGDICSCLALGGAQKRPSEILSKWLKERSLLLFALDYDEAGKKEYAWWQERFSNLEPWPVPMTKSPGDALKEGVDLRQWILSGLEI